MYMRASGASELRKFVHLLILKLLFPSILVLQILCLRNIFRSTITSAYIYNQCSFLSLLMVWHYKRQYADKTLTWRKSMHMRVSGASELRKFLHFHNQKLLFLSIFCWYFRNFVGTCVLAQSRHPPHNREVVASIPGRVIPKDVKRCCRYRFHLKGIETSTYRCSVAAGPTTQLGKKNFQKRFSKFRTINHTCRLICTPPPPPPLWLR